MSNQAADGSAKKLNGIVITAQTIHMIAFALWFGGIIGVGAITAPAAFHFTANYPMLAGNKDAQIDIAAGILGAAFHVLFGVCLGGGVLMLVADGLEIVAGRGARHKSATLLRSVLTVVIVAMVAYQAFHILPLMDNPAVKHTTYFDALHAQAVLLSKLQVPVLIVIAWLTAWRNNARSNA